MHKKITTVLLAFVTTLVALLFGAAPAQAASSAPGNVNIGNACNSQSAIQVAWENNYTGARYTRSLAVCSSSGEGTGKGNGTSEPQSYKTEAGWCSQFQVVYNGVNGTFSSVISGGAYGRWQSIHPGDAYSGREWHIRVFHWNC